MFAGAFDVGYTVVPGLKLQVTLGILEVQETVTAWLNEPAAVIWKLTGDDVVPRGTVTLEGVGGINPMLTKCSVSGSV